MVLLWTVSTRINLRWIIPSRSPAQGLFCSLRSMERVSSVGVPSAGPWAGTRFAGVVAAGAAGLVGAVVSEVPAIATRASPTPQPSTKRLVLIFIVVASLRVCSHDTFYDSHRDSCL